MKIIKFNLSFAGIKSEEIVELPKESTEEEIETEFKEWVWNQLDGWHEEIK